MSRWINVVSLAWISPFPVMSPIRAGSAILKNPKPLLARPMTRCSRVTSCVVYAPSPLVSPKYAATWMASCPTEGSGWGTVESSKTDKLVMWRISLDPYGALLGTVAVKSPRVIDPAVELNCVALLIVMMAVPGVVTLKTARTRRGWSW